MEDLIKLLVEKPDHLLKGFLQFLRALLIIIFSDHIYKIYVFDYQLIDFFKISDWIDFLLSGRFLICLLLYLCLDFILFELYVTLIILPLDLIIKICDLSTDRTFEKIIYWGLTKLKIIEKVTQSNIIKPGAKIEYVKEFYSEETRRYISNAHDLFVFRITGLCAVFILEYLLILNIKQYSLVNILFVFLCILTPMLYVFFRLVVNFLTEDSNQIKEILEGLYFESIILKTLDELGVYDVSSIEQNGYQFMINQSKYVLGCIYTSFIIDESDVRKWIDISKKEKIKMVLLTTSILSDKAIKRLTEKENNVAVLYFKNEKQIKKQLEGYLLSEI